MISGGGEEVCGGGVLLGANGAGKTACFYVIAGLVKPDSGRVLMKGEEVTKLPMHRRARLGLSYLPQDSSIFQGLTVQDNVLAVLEICGVRGDQARTRAGELLEMMGVLHLSSALAFWKKAVFSHRTPSELAVDAAARKAYLGKDFNI